MLQFQDSDRDEISDYFKNRGMSAGGGTQGRRGVDTPTRILGKSNEFLPHESIELPKKNANDPGVVTPRKEYNQLKEKLEELYEQQQQNKLH